MKIYITDEDRVAELTAIYPDATGDWALKIIFDNGPISDRAAELGSLLLNSGFAVCIQDPDVRKAAINGNYAPVHRRWVSYVSSGEYKNHLAISWSRDDGLHTKARKIPNFKWYKSCLYVPISGYMAVEEFSSAEGFKLSPGTQREIQVYKDSIEIVSPSAPKNN